MRRFELTESAETYTVLDGMDNSIHKKHYYRKPQRQTKNSAGYDFYSPVDVPIKPNEVVHIATGYKVYMLEDEFLMIAVRSSMGYAGLELINHIGIIDADYVDNPINDGEIGFRIRNTSDSVYNIKQGDRIGQGVFLKYGITDDDEPVNAIRTGPSGSTGK